MISVGYRKHVQILLVNYTSIKLEKIVTLPHFSYIVSLRFCLFYCRSHPLTLPTTSLVSVVGIVCLCQAEDAQYSRGSCQLHSLMRPKDTGHMVGSE